MDKRQAIEVIRASDISGQADLLTEHLLSSARVILQEDATGTTQESPSSHLGGSPSLPRNATWPVWDSRPHLTDRIARLEAKFQENPKAIGLRDSALRLRQRMPKEPVPLAFLGQLNLSELAATVSLEGWPKQGSLAFFYGSVWGFDPLDRGGSRVLFFSGNEALITADPPPESRKFPERKVIFTQEWTLPSEPTSIWPKEDFRTMRRRLNPLRQQLASLPSDKEPIHRCGGHPDEIQGDMRLKCQLASNGIWCGDSSGNQNPRAEVLKGGAADWRLLLQVDSDARLKWTWGDVGRIYFWARLQDIEAHNFEDQWAVQQCY